MKSIKRIIALLILSFTIVSIVCPLTYIENNIEYNNVKGANVKYVYSKKTINIKKKASSSSKTLKTIKKNTKLQKISVNGQWMKVKYKGQIGYVKKTQISSCKIIDTKVNGKYYQEEAKKALKLVNQERKKVGLSSLKWSSELEDSAKIRASEASISWSHTRPDGSQWYTVSSATYGENLAKNYETAQDAIKAWMASESHKDNILDPDYKTLGIALVKINGVYYWAQEYGL